MVKPKKKHLAVAKPKICSMRGCVLRFGHQGLCRAVDGRAVKNERTPQ